MVRLQGVEAPEPEGQGHDGIYGRQSHASRKSIAEQLDLGRAYCETTGKGEPLVYSDKVSASRYATKSRGDWPRILSDIATGVLRRLWLWESSRGDRKAAEWLDFLDLCATHGVLIHVDTHRRTYDPRVRRDWKVLADDGIDNEDESRMMSERLKRGMAASAAAGMPHAVVPFGFMRQYDARTRSLIRQTADEGVRVTATGHKWTPAGVVRKMFADVKKGVGLAVIAEELNMNGIPTPRQLAAIERGAPMGTERWEHTRWATTTIRRILTSPGAIGKRVSSREVIENGGWDALVDETLFYEVQSIVRDPRRKTTKPGAAKTLLTCLAECDVCDSWITHLKEDPKQWRKATYRCKSRHVCAGVGRDAADRYVTGWLIKWLSTPGRLDALKAADAEASAEAASAWSEVDRLEGQLEEWRAQLDDPDWKGSPAAFARREAVLTNALADAEARAHQLVASTTVRTFGDAETPDDVLKIWDGLTLAVQRQVLRELATFRLRPVGRGQGRRKGGPDLSERLIITPKFGDLQ